MHITCQVNYPLFNVQTSWCVVRDMSRTTSHVLYGTKLKGELFINKLRAIYFCLGICDTHMTKLEKL